MAAVAQRRRGGGRGDDGGGAEAREEWGGARGHRGSGRDFIPVRRRSRSVRSACEQNCGECKYLAAVVRYRFQKKCCGRDAWVVGTTGASCWPWPPQTREGLALATSHEDPDGVQGWSKRRPPPSDRCSTASHCAFFTRTLDQRPSNLSSVVTLERTMLWDIRNYS